MIRATEMDQKKPCINRCRLFESFEAEFLDHRFYKLFKLYDIGRKRPGYLEPFFQ
jgi:hypothetical protein